jgi:hypothetical protein
MSVKELITEKVSSLPDDDQREVLHFVEFLMQKSNEDTLKTEFWNQFSLEQAMKGLEDEPSLYTTADLKERWQ